MQIDDQNEDLYEPVSVKSQSNQLMVLGFLSAIRFVSRLFHQDLLLDPPKEKNSYFFV